MLLERKTMGKNKTVKILLICIGVLAVGFAVCATLFVKQFKANGEQAKADEDVKPTIIQEDEVAEEVTPEVTKSIIKATEVTQHMDDFKTADDKIHINADNVNLRAEPSETAEIVATVPKLTLIRRTGFSEKWSRLSYEETECYVSNDLITEELPEEAVSGTDDPDAGEQTSVSSGGKVVIIDPGHQGRGDSTQEPIGPGASATKGRVTSGTSGVVSGWDEYELNLAVSLQLRDALVQRGYTVFMTREIHDINISNKERAEFAAANNGDILVRIHANGSEDGSVNGALCMAPTNSNTFLPANLISESQRLSSCIISQYVAVTGFNNQGVYPTDEMSGINWSTMPVTIVEMGYMSNASDDAKMADPSMQVNMVQGICNGIDNYFAGGSN